MGNNIVCYICLRRYASYGDRDCWQIYFQNIRRGQGQTPLHCCPNKQNRYSKEIKNRRLSQFLIRKLTAYRYSRYVGRIASAVRPILFCVVYATASGQAFRYSGNRCRSATLRLCCSFVDNDLLYEWRSTSGVSSLKYVYLFAISTNLSPPLSDPLFVNRSHP